MPAKLSKNLENRCLFSLLASHMAHLSYSLFQVSVPTVRKPQSSEPPPMSLQSSLEILGERSRREEPPDCYAYVFFYVYLGLRS
jgi:hypothetical protein